MQLDTFNASLKEAVPPENLSVHLTSLWYDANDNWQMAHDLIQDLPDDKSAWLHAYLHRKEGDEWNAGYWYRKAKKPFPNCTFNQEWEDILKNFLS